MEIITSVITFVALGEKEAIEIITCITKPSIPVFGETSDFVHIGLCSFDKIYNSWELINQKILKFVILKTHDFQFIRSFRVS